MLFCDDGFGIYFRLTKIEFHSILRLNSKKGDFCMKRKNDDIEHICAYCEHAVVIRESDICICREIGAVSADSSCRKFSLDLLKLAPIPRTLPDDDTVFM